jgi:hypothetical protein
MGLARRLERRLEQIVDGISAAIFRGGMPTVEIAERLVRQADLLVADTDAGPTIPNRFIVRIDPRQIAKDVDMVLLGRELTATLTHSAAERGWRTEGPISVSVAADPTVASGTITCDTTFEPGPIPPWGQLLDVNEGVAYELRGNRVVVGRSASADVTLAEPEVSRSHAIVFRKAGAVWVDDLRSANGTRVNGRELDGEPVAIHPGDQIEFGPATFAFRLV